MRFPRKMYLAFLSLLLLLSGCGDELGKVDLSGDIKLQPATKGWAYRNIASTELRTSRVTEHQRLIDFRDELLLEKMITLGKTDYLFVTRFTGGSKFKYKDRFINLRDDSLRDFQTLVYNFETHSIMKTFISKQSDSGDPWDSRIMLLREPHNSKKRLEREGLFHMVFHETDTDWDCIVDSDYSIKSTAVRRTNSKGKPVTESGKPTSDPRLMVYDLKVEGKSEINIGFRQCLAGEKTIANELIEFYVLDWDFDGQFTESDVIWNSYTKKILDFNKEVRLSGSLISSKDNTYVIRLVKNPAEPDPEYLLKIELKSTGKR